MTSRARRTAVVTPASSTAPAGGSEVRARSSPRCSRSSGSGRSFRVQRTSGQPVRATPSRSAERSTAAVTAGTPAASASAFPSSSTRPVRSRRPSAAASSSGQCDGEPGRGPPDVGDEPVGGRPPGGHPVGELAAQLGHPRAGAGRHRAHRRGGETLPVQQGPQVGQALLHGDGVEPVDLVEDDEQHPGVPGERDEIAVVHRRVGVLLRIEHPHQDVDETDEPVDLEAVLQLDAVVVGEVEQDQSVQRRFGLVPVPAGHFQPVEQPVGPVLPPHGRVRDTGRGPAHARAC